MIDNRRMRRIAFSQSRPHPLIAAVKHEMEHEWVWDGVLKVRGAFLAIEVSPDAAPRALTLMANIIARLEGAGWKVSTDASGGRSRTVIERSGVTLRLRLTEDFERTPKKKPVDDTWDHDRKIFAYGKFSKMPLGTFRLTLIDDELYSNEKTTKLTNVREESLDKLDVLIERAIRRRTTHKANLQAIWDQRAAEEALRAKQREAELVLERRRQDDLKRREGLLAEAELWRRCEDARDYLAAVRQAAEETADNLAWLSWAAEAIASIDPLVRRVRPTAPT